jgi:hypothetical protein
MLRTSPIVTIDGPPRARPSDRTATPIGSTGRCLCHDRPDSL